MTKLILTLLKIKNKNMKQLFFLLFLPSILFSQTKKETWYDLNQTKLHEIFYVSTDPPYLKSGNYKEYSKNGKLKKDYNYLNGELNGICKNFYDDGITIKSQETWKAGKKNGTAFRNSEDGKKEFEGAFINDLPNGAIKSYYKNGNINELTTYLNGVLNGKKEIYDENGKILLQEFYINGVLDGKKVKYYDNGQLSNEEFYSNGLENGTFNAFYLNGNPMLKSTKKNGKWIGDVIYYHENGKKKFELYMNDGIKEGPAKKYYEDGTLEMEANYLNGIIVGPSKSYYPNGKLFSEDNYALNEFDGLRNTYYQSGSKHGITNWKNGKKEGKREVHSQSGVISSSVIYSNDLISETNPVYLNKILDKTLKSNGNGIESLSIDLFKSGSVPEYDLNLIILREYFPWDEDTIRLQFEMNSDAFCVLHKNGYIKFQNNDGNELKLIFKNNPIIYNKNGRYNQVELPMSKFTEFFSKGIKAIGIECFDNSNQALNEKAINDSTNPKMVSSGKKSQAEIELLISKEANTLLLEYLKKITQ